VGGCSWHRDVPGATPLQSFESQSRRPLLAAFTPRALESLPGVGGVFRVVDLFATVTRATARCCLRTYGLWIVGTLHAPSLTFHRLRLMTMRVYEGLPVHARLGVGSTNGPALMTFTSPTETVSGLRCPASVVRSSPDLAALLLASMRLLDSSHGVVKYPPLRRLECLVSSPGETAAPKSCRHASSRGKSLGDAEAPSVRGCHLPDTFRPCCFSQLRRFAPPCTLQVCCALLPIMGFAMFPVLPVVVRGLIPSSAEAGRSDLDLGCFPAAPRRGVHPAAFRRPCCGGLVLVTPRGRLHRHRRGEARTRFLWTFPNGAPPFEAFPSSVAVPRQSHFSAALRLLCRHRASSILVLLLERDSALWHGSPQSLPSRRWLRALPSSFRLSACEECHRGGGFPLARPQGFRPLTNPLRSPGISTWHAPDASLGFAH
jgi:hypothetical protein